jgi:hypothetical protein
MYIRGKETMKNIFYIVLFISPFLGYGQPNNKSDSATRVYLELDSTAIKASHGIMQNLADNPKAVIFKFISPDSIKVSCLAQGLDTIYSPQIDSKIFEYYKIGSIAIVTFPNGFSQGTNQLKFREFIDHLNSVGLTQILFDTELFNEK